MDQSTHTAAVGEPAPASPGLLSIERVVVLLTPLFGAIASWIVAFIATHVPGAPHLDHTGVEGIVIAVFLGVAALVVKWLGGRQQTQAELHEVAMANLHYANDQAPTAQVVDLSEVRARLTAIEGGLSKLTGAPAGESSTAE